MRLMLLCQCLAALWTALALLLYVYVRSFYRLSSWTDLGTALQTARLPRVDSRCKSARLTQSNSSVEKQQQQMHGLQCLPNVLFIGASKCGTTSLVNYLAQHPQIYFVRRRINSVYNRSTATNNSSSIRSGAGAGKTTKHREIHRFDRNTFGWAWKPLDLIDEWASSPIVPNTKSVVIHYTPHYLYAPSVPFAAKAFYPHARDMKLVVMLRDPVERALSSYWFKNSHLFQQTDQGRHSYINYP